MQEWVRLSADTAPALGGTLRKTPEVPIDHGDGSGHSAPAHELGECVGRIIQVGAHWSNQPEGRSGWWVLVEYATPDYSRFCERYGHADGSPESLREYREYAENRELLGGLAATEPTEAEQDATAQRARQILEKIRDAGGDGSLSAALCDGEALAAIGVTAADQEAVENAYQMALEADGLPVDQAREWEPDCQTWPIYYAGGQRGQMTVWPNGRGAVSWGGDSAWGEWDGATLVLDSGERVNSDGQVMGESGPRRYTSARNMGLTAASDLEQWAASRGTAMPVAVAIHAISDPKEGRTANDIWKAPSPAEVDQVRGRGGVRPVRGLPAGGRWALPVGQRYRCRRAPGCLRPAQGRRLYPD